ncbi:E3 ubiquitin ligase [Orbilia ellipsospora]|uniref:E3 ubiquitin ligase n=1 Tax=Orbilia ellipsospora TaxID=2528407 RepID=A0AAV9WY59_9PEZI
MDFSPTRPVPTSSSLFTNPSTAKPPTINNLSNGHVTLQSGVAIAGASSASSSTSTSASASASLKRASTEPADVLSASASMPALRSRSHKVAKNSLNGGEPANLSNQLQNGDMKAPSPPAPLYDPRDDQIKDLQSDLTKLQKLVTCVVCQDLLFEPYSLGCGHVFCYSCLKDWFRQKKTCPECRARVKHQPAPAYLIRSMIDTFVVRAELQSPHEEGLAFRQQQEEALKLVDADKNDAKGLFGGMFTKKPNGGMAIYDPEDGVARCPDCSWEIENRRCPSCGRRFHASEMPGADSDASDASDFSLESDLEEEDDDESISVSDRSGTGPDDDMHEMDDYLEDDHEPWDEPDYDEDHRLALALQDQYHQEFMRHLGVPANFLEEQFGVDRALAARAAAREYMQRSLSRATFSTSPGRSLRHSSPFSRTSDEDSEENTLDEDDSDMDDFIVHDTPERRQRRNHPTARTLRRHAGRSVADISDDEEDDDEEEEEEDDEPVVGRRSSRTNRYYERRTITISSDNDDDEEATGLISAGYAQLDHDTTTGDENDDDDSQGESDIGQILRPAGPLRAHTMPATMPTGPRRSLREQALADRSSTPPRRRRRTVTFQVPEDADGENDSDARDDEGDLDMDRHSRAGSTSLASITSNRTDASTHAPRSGGNSFSQDTPSVNEDESSDDSAPRQRSNRRRIGNTTSSSNLRRAPTAPPTGGTRNRVNRPTSSVDPVVHRLLRNFNAQRNESQFEQLGMSVPEGGISDVPAPRSASHYLQELNEPIVISSSPAQNFFPAGSNHSGQSPTAVRSFGLGLLSPQPQPSPQQTSREASVVSTSSAASPSVISAPVQQISANIGTLPPLPSAWEIAAATPSVTSSTAATVGTPQNGSTNRGSMRTRRSNAALRGQDIQRTGTPTNRMAVRSNRSQPSATTTTTDRENIHRRARDLIAGRTRDLQERSAGTNGQTSIAAANSNARPTRTTQTSSVPLSLTQRYAERLTGRGDNASPGLGAQLQTESANNAPQRGIVRTDTGGSSGRRRGYQIGTGNNPGPMLMISDEDN